MRDLARRFGIRPSKALGQNFLIDPNLARAIASDAEVGPGTSVVEVGAGFGSLTLALAGTGPDRVIAIEFDRALIPALASVLAGHPEVTVRHGDALRMDLAEELPGAPWTLCANLPYNISVPLVLTVLDSVPAVTRLVVMVQREVGERLVAGPGQEAYGAVSVRVAYRATGAMVRRVPSAVFWPRPRVDSVVVRLDRLAAPPVTAPEAALWRVVDAGFAERRKTMRNALRRLGLEGTEADAVLTACGVDPSTRAEALSLATFAEIAERMPA